MHQEPELPSEFALQKAAKQVKVLAEQFTKPGSLIFICTVSGKIAELNQQAAEAFNVNPTSYPSIFSLFNSDFESYFSKSIENQSEISFSATIKDRVNKPCLISIKTIQFENEAFICVVASGIGQQLHIRNSQLEFINSLLVSLASCNSYQEIASTVLNHLLNKNDLVGGGVYQYNSSENSLQLIYNKGKNTEPLTKNTVIPVSEDLVQKLVNKNEPEDLKRLYHLIKETTGNQKLLVLPFQSETNFIATLVLVPKHELVVSPALISFIEFIRYSINNFVTRFELHLELYYSENKYHALFDSSNEAIFLLDGFLLTDCNQRLSDLLGYRKEEIIGKSPLDFSPEMQPDSNPSELKARELFQEVLDKGEPQIFEWELIHKDGHTIEVEIYMAQAMIVGKPFVQGSLRDLSIRKLAQTAARREEVLRESIQHFRDFLEKLNLAYIRVDINGNILGTNDYFLNYTEYTLEEIIGKNYFKIFTPEEEKEKRLESFEKTIREEVNSNYYERDIVTKSGVIKTLRWNSVFEKDAEGNVTGLTSVGKDMTDKRVAMEALKDNKIRLQDLFDNAHDLIQNISVDNKFIFVNKAWKDKLGYDDHDIEKLTLNDIVHPYYKAKLIYQLRNLYKGENLNKIETVFLTKTGKPIHLIGSINCSWQDGRPVATRAILHDITDRIKAERLQKVYYSIANLAISSKDLKSLYAAIHRELSKIIETHNIYIALSNQTHTELSFVYFIDEFSSSRPNLKLNRAFSTGFSEYVIRNGKPIYALKKDLIELEKRGKITPKGELPEVILCSPLAIGDRIIGVIAVQDYKNPDAYIQTDIEILHFISNQIALAIERKQNEEKINHQNARLKAIFESGSHLMWTMNRNYQLISFNKNFATVFHNKSGETADAGRKLIKGNIKFIKPQSQRLWYDKYKNAFYGEPQHFELQLKEDGENNWLEVYLNPIYLEDGSFEEVSAIALDITEKKKSQLALTLSEEKFRRIFESFQDLFIRSDENHKITLISPSVKEILGYDSDEILGKDRSLIFRDENEINRLSKKVHKEGTVKNFETKLRSKTGKEKDMLLNARVVSDEFGNPVGIEAVCRDISKLKETQRELIRAKDMAENLLQVKTQFLANMSHELRTPMNGIIGMIDLLHHTISTEEQKEYIDTLRKSSDALLAILNDILDLSKIQAGKMELNTSAIDLDYTLEKIHSLFANRAQQKELSFTYQLCPGTPRYIITDETRFLQVLSNLTSNAIKFTNAGSVSIIVKNLEKHGEQHKLKIEVKDSGIGIKEESKELLFTNFTQLDNSSSKSFGGTGLGLAISKQLSELLGGEIGLESEYGKGSTFWFTITCTETNREAVKESTQTETLYDFEEFDHEPYVLLVDDNLINQKVAQKLLQKIGCKADIASDGFEAIEKARTGKYELIFMDIQMPEMDGVTATQKIKAILKEKCPPIVAMTAYSMKNDAEKFMSQGLDDYVSKPVKTNDLRQVITRWNIAKALPATEIEEEEEEIADVIDTSIFQQLKQMGGAEFAIQLYEEFEQETGPILEAAKNELKSKHYNSILSKLHQIKGTGFTLGLNPLAEAAKKLEHNIKTDQLAHVDEEFDILLHQFELYTKQYRDITTNL